MNRPHRASLLLAASLMIGAAMFTDERSTGPRRRKTAKRHDGKGGLPGKHKKRRKK